MPVEQFIGERIEVEQAADSPRPVRFVWRGQTHEVVEVLIRRVDAGFGDHPAASRKWYTRRHRRYYWVRDQDGHVYEIYLDYSNKQRTTWWLVRRVEQT